MIQRTKTNDKKTAILILLLLSALPKLVLSPIKRVSFKILNTLKSLRARKASKEFVPTTRIEMYFGINRDRSFTLNEIGEQFSLTRERVRQIKEKAIRRLAHKTRSEPLRVYLGQ